jgi:filamentous hemagglutinin
MDRINAGMAKAFSDLLDKTVQIAGAAANLVSPLGDMLTAAGENPTVHDRGARVTAGAMAVLGTLGTAGDVEKAAARLSTSEAADLAGYLGYTRRVKDAPFNSHGQAVFTNGRTFITEDVDMHLGTDATWKMFSRRGQRMGTFGGLLNRLGN